MTLSEIVSVIGFLR